MFTDGFAIASAARISRHAAGAALWCRRNSACRGQPGPDRPAQIVNSQR